DKNLLESICRDMSSAAEKLGIAIVGGHSEVTPGLDHPIVVVFPVGVARGENYVVCRNIKPGNKIILTKSIAIEGTAILAHDREEPIRRRFGEAFVARSKAYFNELSILTEALAAFNAGGVTGMHDPTEGGLAGGLNEMCDAAGVGFRVYEDRIPIRQETAKICELFRVNPFALISSGCLLVAVEADKAEKAKRRILNAGVYAVVVGETLSERETRVLVRKNGYEEKLAMPLSDELWSALQRGID
ncbi:MAG: AIR synthase-related protein, partial [Candidatus Bathyarchaeia archaeon]